MKKIDRKKPFGYSIYEQDRRKENLLFPFDFYVQYASLRGMIDNEMQHLQTSAVESSPIVNPMVGMPYLAINIYDRKLYRVLVLSVFRMGWKSVLSIMGTKQNEKLPSSQDSSPSRPGTKIYLRKFLVICMFEHSHVRNCNFEPGFSVHGCLLDV